MAQFYDQSGCPCLDDFCESDHNWASTPAIDDHIDESVRVAELLAEL